MGRIAFVVPSLLAALDAAGGTIEDPRGRAVGAWAQAAGVAPETVRTQVPQMELDGLVVREIRGRRTYRVALVEIPEVLRAAVERWEPPEALPEARGGLVVNGPPQDLDDLAEGLLEAATGEVLAEADRAIDAPTLSVDEIARALLAQVLAIPGMRAFYDDLLRTARGDGPRGQ